MKRARLAVILAALCALRPAAAGDPPARTLLFRFTPTARAQIALWIETADGKFLKTLLLTQAVALRGIGNRPGASQMNSGFRWPYGRREGVLPVWAHRRAAAAGATPFRRIIFQDRTSEGLASRTSNDNSKDDYFCLSFKEETTRKDALDAVSCASPFTSDKGRFVTDSDVTKGYAEPQENAGVGKMVPLDKTSFYPPRHDIMPCGTAGCFDHPDVAQFAAEAKRVMPDIDAVSAATPAADMEKIVMMTVPADWADGAYVAWLEVNTEGDYDDVYNDKTYPTPDMPMGAWDSWAIGYGYPYRGQPSVVYKVPFTLGGESTAQVMTPAGFGSLSGQGADGGALHMMDGKSVVDDPAKAPGSGADRLRPMGGGAYRIGVETHGQDFCLGNTPPGAPADLLVSQVADVKHSHEWAHLEFTVPGDDKGGVVRYEVRVGTEPITDEASFMNALPANGATADSVGLVVPTGDPPGTRISVTFGGLMPTKHYWVGVRADDQCNASGPIAVGEVTTTRINFTKLSGCFVATAAFGTPLAEEIDVLRHLRDRQLLANPVGRAAVAVYYDVGPVLADAIRGSDALRAGVRALLAPVVDAARILEAR